MSTNGSEMNGRIAGQPPQMPEYDGDPSREAGPSEAEGFMADTLNLISEHKGKLAFGAAATLGLMILYNWREKSLAEEDPEDYARLKKFTAPFKTPDEIEQEEFERRMREGDG